MIDKIAEIVLRAAHKYPYSKYFAEGDADDAAGEVLEALKATATYETVARYNVDTEQHYKEKGWLIFIPDRKESDGQSEQVTQRSQD